MSSTTRHPATYEAPPNIALVKYWGVRDVARALPYNSSFSVTLAGMRSHTRVEFDPALTADLVVLNHAAAEEGPRLAVVRFLDRVRSMAGIRERAHVESENDFPTASGLASSASGFAALAGAASRAAGLRLTDRAIAQLARYGSGSACRSVFGGFVEWHAGEDPDGRDCYAEPAFGPNHWPQLVDLVVLVRDAPVKEVRSADAMQTTVRTSEYFPQRQKEVPLRLKKIRAAIGAKSAEKLFPLVMEECDSFRKACETSRPSLDYLTSTSRAVIAAVQHANESARRPIAAYTHDAGAHVHVFTLQRNLARLETELGAIDGVERTLVVRPGPGAHEVSTRSAPTARAGRTRAPAARGRSRSSAR